MEIEQKIMLDVGCGFNCQPGFVGMDKRDVKGVQICHDKEETPGPLDNEPCSVIMMGHLIEHIKPWKQFDVINEAWRVLEVGGQLLIATPQYFCPGTYLYDVYRPKPWAQERLFWNQYANLECVLKKLSVKKGKKIHGKFKRNLGTQQG